MSNPVEILFEPADLAGIVWWATGAMVALGVVRYVVAGQRPSSRGQHGVIASLAVATVAVLAASGWLHLHRVPHGWVCLIFAVLFLPWLVRTYRRTTRPIPPGWRVLLVGLRLAAGLVVVILLARPVLQRSIEKRERAVLGLMLDTSRSMDVRDVVPESARADPRGVEPVSRVEQVRRMLAASRRSLERVTDHIDVEYMSFDARTRRTDAPQPAATGSTTALTTCLDGARELLIQKGTRVAGLIVVSDGRDTTGVPADVARAGDDLATAGIPLYAVAVGNELPAGQTRSLQARRLDMPDRVSVLNRLDVGAEFLTAGLVGTEITVRLEYDGHAAGEQKIVPTQIRQLVRADLSHVPREGGLHQVTVTAQAAGLQGRQAEAKLSRYVRVTEDKVQVLYIDRGRYERAAIARALELAKELNVTKIDLNGAPDASGTSVLPRTPEEWRLYHVILLGDVERSQLPDAAMQAMADLVTTAGRGLAMLGGLRTLGSGGFRGTPLEPLLAVSLAATGQIDGAVAFELTPAGRAHPCCRLVDANEAAWKQLPPFAGASRLGTVAPGAEVLIRATAGDPLMVVQERSGGRTAVLAFDSTWQWPFACDAGLDMQRRFWRQLVLWLANRKPEVWVMADRSQYDLLRVRSGDELVTLQAGINDPATGSLPAQSTLTGETVGPDGATRKLEFKPGRDGFEASPVTAQPGSYRVRVEGRIAGQPAGHAETAFVVESVDRELADPLADPETLKRLAARTASIGGEFVPADRLGELLERIASSGLELKTTVLQREYLTDDHPWFWLAVFVALLAAEWTIRRRKGLV